jgi:hypothetical protein
MGARVVIEIGRFGFARSPRQCALVASFACRFLLIKPVGKAIPADVPTLWQRGVSMEAANMLPFLAPRALAVIVRSYCHRLLLSGSFGCRRPAGAVPPSRWCRPSEWWCRPSELWPSGFVLLSIEREQPRRTSTTQLRRNCDANCDSSFNPCGKRLCCASRFIGVAIASELIIKFQRRRSSELRR